MCWAKLRWERTETDINSPLGLEEYSQGPPRQVEAAPGSSQIVRGTLRWGGLNIGEAARAWDGTPKALPRGHESFIGTSALGQPPPRLS